MKTIGKTDSISNTQATAIFVCACSTGQTKHYMVYNTYTKTGIVFSRPSILLLIFRTCIYDIHDTAVPPSLNKLIVHT